MNLDSGQLMEKLVHHCTEVISVNMQRFEGVYPTPIEAC